jgi:DNA invertase Pin-like site-specific DNA recombinase
MDYGYARVSTKASRNRKRVQHVDNQVDRLKAQGIPPRRIFTDEYTGRKFDRPDWVRLMAVLEPGDRLYVTKMDRLGRSMVDLVKILLDLTERGVVIYTLDQGVIDPSTPTGKLLMHFMAALAEWESDMARERTREGLEAAVERHGGQLPLRGKAEDTDLKLAKARALVAAGTPVRDACKAAGISKTHFYRTVNAA